ncbi:MAG TPA: PEP-CTERM sorting domain-containing protein [Burkholderiaceae bacterium]|nr:PEP-CTERM sorting domain-containing protein [Burkholderiaceae bacterium]
MTSIRFASFVAAATLGLAAPAQAAWVSCPGTAVVTDREFRLDTAPASICLASGNANIQGDNASQDQFLSDPAFAGWSYLDKDPGASPTGGLPESVFSFTGLDATSGTFSVAASLWATYADLAIGFKSGGGGATPTWAVFQLADGVTGGDWSILSPGNGQQSLSHAVLYGSGRQDTTTVPAPAGLALLGIGLAALVVARRRRG